MTSPITRRRFGQGAATALMASALASGASVLAPRRAAAAETLNFQANWLNDPEFIGYMVAIDKGYYAAEGLHVNYMPGGPDLIPEGSLLSSKADIALTAIVSTVTAIAEKGAPFKIIGAQYQKSPLGVISLAAGHIKGPKDLIGKTVACPPLSLTTFLAMLKANGIAKSSVHIVPYSFNPMPLVSGNVDAVVDFVTEIPFVVEQKGKKASYFLFWDYGLPLYIDLVVVTTDTLKTKRAQLINFFRASRKGWTLNNADPTKYPKEFAKTWFKGNGSTLGAEIYHNKAQIPLMANPKGLYVMDADAIARNIAALAKVGLKGRHDMFDGSVLAEV